MFLRHVAPTRYGDQAFAAGEHLAPGSHSGALRLLREPLCMYYGMYNVSILEVFPYFYHCITLLIFSCLFCFCFLIKFICVLCVSMRSVHSMRTAESAGEHFAAGVT